MIWFLKVFYWNYRLEEALKLKLMICCEYYLEVDTAVVYNAVCIDVHYVENVYPWPQIV